MPASCVSACSCDAAEAGLTAALLGLDWLLWGALQKGVLG